MNMGTTGKPNVHVLKKFERLHNSKLGGHVNAVPLKGLVGFRAFLCVQLNDHFFGPLLNFDFNLSVAENLNVASPRRSNSKTRVSPSQRCPLKSTPPIRNVTSRVTFMFVPPVLIEGGSYKR
ncbi:hypothetical protein [Thermococcus sp. JCM 11816]|uniref:hypothetical protein n=1 Tax=Thermococcus sp. (strain JCM 11816 / KS-1) TaxID=1295125 RepID=UPI003467A8AD